MSNKLLLILLCLCAFVNAESQTTLILHPSADAQIGFHDNFNSANVNGGNANYFGAFYQPGAIGGYNGGRGLMNFDLSSIPAGSVITSAKLDLHGIGPLNANGAATSVGNCGDNQCYLERVTTSWGEYSVTWNTQPVVTGSDVVLLPKSDSIQQDYLGIDVTQLFQDMIDDPSNSFGFRIGLVNEQITKGLFFCSSNDTDQSKIPTLTITFVNGNCSSPVLYNIKLDNVDIGFHDNYNSANENYKTADYFGAFYQPGASGGYNGGRALMALNLSSIPPGQQITSAKISLYGIGPVGPGDATSVGSIGANQCYLELIDSGWVDSLVTWNLQPSVSIVDRVLLPASTSTTQDYIGVDVTRLVQDMINNPAHNYGFEIRLVNEVPSAGLFFASNWYSDSTKWPKLIVTVCGPTSGCLAYFTSGSSKDSVYLHNYSSANIRSATWNFGDSSFSNNTYFDSTFTHHYKTPGNYNICLTTSDSSGTCRDTFCRIVHACNTDASFTYSINNNIVTCTSTSSNAIKLHWSFGDGSSNTNNLASISHTYAFAGQYRISLQVWGDSSYQCFDSTSSVIQITISNADTLSGVVFDDIDANGSQSANEPGLSGLSVTLSDSNTVYAQTISDSTGHYHFYVGAGTWNININYPSSWSQTIPVNPWHYTITDTSGENVNAFNFGLHNDLVTISGTVFYDNNSNGVQDSGEAGVAYQFIQIGFNFYFTDANGNYAVTLLPGNYNISYYPFSSGYIVTVPASGSYNLTATDSGQIYSGNNFGIWADPTLKDLAINISPYTNVARGFQAWYLVSFTNYGANFANATITMNYDSSFIFDSADNFPSVDQTNHTITWNLGSIAPGYYGSLNCWFDVPKTLPLGTMVLNWAAIQPIAGDLTPSNNVDSLYQMVEGSFDPNEKEVSPSGPIRPNQALSYTIEFQNTGTAPAVNIVVLDTLSPNLDWATFKMLSSSNPYTVQRSGAVVKWTFTDIMLPDSGTSQQGSIGFVKYSVLPIPTIGDGSTINNFADIYFDFNDPVRTNTTGNVINLSLNSSKIHSNQLSIITYPNPMDDFTNLIVNGAANEKYQVCITNMLGQKLETLTGTTGQALRINRQQMTSGLYLYEVFINGVSMGKGKIAVN